MKAIPESLRAKLKYFDTNSWSEFEMPNLDDFDFIKSLCQFIDDAVD